MKSKSLARQNLKGIHISGYDIVRVLGKGSFGVVRLVRERSESSNSPASSGIEALDGHASGGARSKRHRPKQLYAMKVIRKSDMLRNSQEGHLRAERDFLVASENSKWVVPLISSFQDNNNLYLVMEYMIGGDFLGLLLREDILDEGVSQFYIAEMILCVEETHRMNWIHRDVKPDNFLITASGHLKISDFGLAFDGHWTHNQTYYNEQRYSLLRDLDIFVRGDDQDYAEELERQKAQKLADVINGKTFRRDRSGTKSETMSGPVLDWLNRTQRRSFAKSVVGTSQYMAPEVIRGETYDGRCDWWSIGIILYECLYGCTPFFCDNRTATKERILRHKQTLKFPTEQRYSRPASDRVPLNAVSHNGMDLIMRLLDEKETRLSAKKYRDNDFVIARKTFGSRYMRNIYHAGHFVFRDDAEDIKAHPFFYGVDWKTIHLMRPPFVPRLRGDQPITKYFDDEADIMSESDHLDSSSYSSHAVPVEKPAHPSNGAPKPAKEALDAMKAQLESHYKRWNAPKRAGDDMAAKEGEKKRRRKKEKKRPRDKLLRDPQLGRTVLELRKKGAFIGYTYRRPRFTMGEFDGRAGRMAGSRAVGMSVGA
ncbi:kinase-like protein [Lepidopterella palustris CBS 459.81]|uniref:non-specific serine/threonine protein kinase n=1 Tax=Lepidopterella palustris CBS 459.81 TaxID=1314670 RepID=A0A8E2EFV1_9PEZI|nr:kinase-like protein [Lepidopterella palustris CBS 459.81]